MHEAQPPRGNYSLPKGSRCIASGIIEISELRLYGVRVGLRLVTWCCLLISYCLLDLTDPTIQ